MFDARFFLELATFVGTQILAFGLLLYTRGKQDQKVADRLDASIEIRKSQHIENERRLEKLNNEMVQLNEHGGTSMSLQLRSVNSQLNDHSGRVRALEAGHEKLEVISTNIEWIKKTLDTLSGRIDKTNGNHATK